MVDDALEAIYLEHCPSRSESDHRQSALDNLQNYLNQHFDPTIELQLFGSSKNGFGFGGSDMDICLMFTGYREEPPAQYNSAADVITALSNVLKNNKMMTNVTPVINARVPIVKFEYFYNNKVYEGDISYYNMLAQRNTELLMTYANIDERCQKLGYVLKAMVKDCDIGDASRGFLSSYAYIILMIHYLQQVSVLPVLQELHEESQQPENLCEGFNTWFQDDPHAIKRLFTCENNKSLSRLWIGFLQYYTECFHFEMITVQIRQRDTLMKCDKFGWSSKPICIEDPFELTHNLGRNVSPENIHCITEQFRLYLGVTTANTFSISRGEK